jgi:hypothetical protein
MWINVKDQLPLVSIKGGIWTSLVLVWCYDGYMCIAQYDYFDKCWQGNGGKVDVTHWMPLPEPPTAVNSGAQTEQASNGESAPLCRQCAKVYFCKSCPTDTLLTCDQFRHYSSHFA